MLNFVTLFGHEIKKVKCEKWAKVDREARGGRLRSEEFRGDNLKPDTRSLISEKKCETT